MKKNKGSTVSGKNLDVPHYNVIRPHLNFGKAFICSSAFLFLYVALYSA
jgi:hypothetical protein